MTPTHQVEAFLEMLASERGASTNTLSAYKRDLTDFAAYGRSPKSVATASRDDIESYLRSLADAGLSASTAARRLSTLRQFFQFLVSEGQREDNPTSVIDGPQKGRPLPKILSEKDVEQLLKTAGQQSGPEGLRLNCLLEVLYASGLRVSELVGLPLSAVRRQDRVIFVKGKGGRERLVPLSPTSLSALERYLEVRPHFLTETIRPSRSPNSDTKSNKWLFPSRGALGHLTRQRFAQLLKELAVKSGVSPVALSPHTIRHAFATHLLAHGADLRSVQKMLGHADISTTQIYTHIQEQRLNQLVSDHHPLSKKSA